MLPRADLNTMRPPAALEASTRTVSSTDPRLELFRRLTQISIGRELQATVDSMLDDGTYLVRVDNAAARMALPAGTKAGDTLPMVLVAKEPRPTFLLLTGQQGSAPASLSPAARLIDHLIHSAQQDGAQPAAVVAKTPLLPSSAALDPGQMASALEDSIAASGLFYESHLHDWISGSRPLSDLAREPQAKLPNGGQVPDTSAQQGAAKPEGDNLDLTRLAANLRELGDGVHKLIDLMQNARLQPANPLNTDADVIAHTGNALPNVEPEAAHIINLQLNALEHQQIRWQGELWPGQKLEWEITEDEQGGGATAPQGQQTWISTVRFQLPHLGEISATIRLTGERVHVQVNTESEDTAAALREFGNVLAEALDMAGSPLDSLLIKQDEPDA